MKMQFSSLIGCKRLRMRAQRLDIFFYEESYCKKVKYTYRASEFCVLGIEMSSSNVRV